MKSEMYLKIEQSTSHLKSRTMVSNFALKNEANLDEITALAFDVTHDLHVQAFWSLDLLCMKKMKLFSPYIQTFTEILPTIKNDSALRPATKICFLLAKSNHRKNGIDLTQEQEHNIIENLIDRLIREEKVASKVYAMKALYVFGKKYNWVHEELKPIITQDAFQHSAAYIASARNILKKMDSFSK